MKQKTIGLALIFLSLGVLGFWEFWGRENLSYEDVLVFRTDVVRGTAVEKNMLEIRRLLSERISRSTAEQSLWMPKTMRFMPIQNWKLTEVI